MHGVTIKIKKKMELFLEKGGEFVDQMGKKFATRT